MATVGDGSREISLGELTPLRGLALAIPIPVFVDTQLGLIELQQSGWQLLGLAVNCGAADYPAAKKRALGDGRMRVRDRAALAGELKVTYTRNRFTIPTARGWLRALCYMELTGLEMIVTLKQSALPATEGRKKRRILDTDGNRALTPLDSIAMTSYIHTVGKLLAKPNNSPQ